LGPGRNRASMDAERVAADIFSCTIRVYSAGEHVPRAIIRLRRPMVSHDENANSVIITANDAGLLRLRLLIAGRWDEDGAEQAHPRASANSDASPTFLVPAYSRSRPMADDRTQRGSQDRLRINMSEDYEVAYWSQKWGISRQELAAAVTKAGPMAAAVAKLLGKEP
jgi:hypothetical protein